MKKVLNKNNFIFILILMTLFNLIMPTISYAANVSINDMMKETVAGWYAILKALVVGAMIVLVLIIALKAAITKRSSDTALVKSMLKDWFVALALILFIDYFMIFAIEVNEAAVAGAEQIGQKLSGMEEGQEISLYESVFTKAYEIKFKPGTIGMILYIMLVYYAYKFTLVYLKRYINVIVLIITAPIICGFHAFKKVITGKAITLKKWFKEFIYNVFLQSLHAIMYGTLVGLTLKFSEDGESFIGAILTMIIFAVIFKVDKLVRKLFNKIGGDTSIAVSKIDSTVSNAISTSKQVGSNQMGSLAGNGNIFNQENEYGGWIDNKINNQFGEDLKWGMVTDGIRTDTKNGWMSLQNDFRTGKDNLKDTFSDISGTIKGEHKQVSEEAIAREQEKMDNAGFFGKAWHTMLTMPGIISEKVNKKSEELRLYLETKKNETINNIQTLQRDVQTIKAIPKLIKSVRKMPESVVMTQNPVTKQLEYDDKYEALIDLDVDTEELEERIITFIHMSLGQISTAVVLAQGYEALLHSPKLGMMMLAEQNYKDMVHPEIPYEERRIVAGFKHEIKPRLKFKRFENGAIDTIEQVVIMDATQVFAGLRTLKRVGAAVRNQTISYRSVPDGAETTIVRFTGKADASKKMYSNIQLTLQGLRTFRSDVQIARNINLLNEIQNIENRNMLSNLTPEMLVTLERAGIAIKVPENGDFSGGYIILNHALDNAIMINRIENYLSTNEGTPMAQTLNQFLLNNPENEVAIKISNYLIDNPDSVLVSLINDVEVTEDGRLIKRIDSFTMDGQIPVLSQLGVINENTIVQTIITEEGEIVEQVIDLQGNIVSPATDEQGNIVEFPSENGRVLQTIVTPDGNLIQQLVSSDGTTVKPIIINDLITEKTSVEQLDSISGVITEITTASDEIQIINKETGEIEVLDLDYENIQLVQNEDGTIELIDSEKQASISISESVLVQVIKPEDATVQIFDIENHTVETAYGEVAIQVLKEKGITLSPEQEVEFKEREELKSILTEISDARAVDLETGEIENIVELRQETEILTALTKELAIQETEVPTEEEQMSKLNDLLDQISEAQSIELTTSLFENMEEEREKVLVEVGVKDLDNPKLLQQVAEYSTVTSSVYTDDIATYQLDETVGMISSNKTQSAENTSYEVNDPISEMIELLLEKDTNEKTDSYSTSESIDADRIETITASELVSDTVDYSIETAFDVLLAESVAEASERQMERVIETVTTSTEEVKSEKFDINEILKNVIDEPKEKVERWSSKSKTKKTEKNTSTNETEERKIKIRIDGAVNKPGEYLVKYGIKVYEAVNIAGKCSNKVDKEIYAQEIANKIIDENNTYIHIPEIVQTKGQDKKDQDKKSNTNTNKITIYLTGEGVLALGKKELDKGITIGSLITNFKSNANKNAIEVNNQKVSLEYKLRDKDMVYVPIITDEELDRRRNIDINLVKYIIRQQVDKYKTLNKDSKEFKDKNDSEILECFLDNKTILDIIVNNIMKKLKEKNIELPISETLRRLRDYLEEEIKKLRDKKDNTKSTKNNSTQTDMQELFENLRKETVFVSKRHTADAKRREQMQGELSADNIVITEDDRRKNERTFAIINEMMKTRKSMGTN